jgi:hypothetical protein
MDYLRVQNAIEEAREFEHEHADVGISFEALVMMCYLDIGNVTTPNSLSPTQCRTNVSPPPWFSSALAQFAGRRVTAKDVLQAMSRPTDMLSLREAGAWLRSIYGEPTRSGGRITYRIPYIDDQTVEQSQNRAIAATVPSWLQSLMAQNRHNLRGTMSVGAVAEVLGIPRNVNAKLDQLAQHLTALGYSAAGSGMFYFG